jgi:hypothetical protein
MIRGLRVALVLLAAGAAVPAATASASTRVPQGFVGMMADGPIFNGGVNLGAQLDRMVASGVESVRVVFDWAQAQPYQTWADVPSPERGAFVDAGGAPTDFATTDQIVRFAAQRGLAMLPVVVYAPPWDAVSTGSQVQPVRDQPYGQYLTELIARYGPRGTFWAQNSDVAPMPIRQWQVWNEPDLTFFWSTFPFQKSFVALLKTAHDAIKGSDPGAQVVLAGLSDRSWHDLGSIYKVRGARSLFDMVALHPYTAQPQGVVTIAGLIRRVMDRYGDQAKPMLITELGWPSSLGLTANTVGVATTQAGQAQRLAAAIPLVAAARARLGIAGFDVYTWMGNEQPGSTMFNFAGLLGFDPNTGAVATKPALAAFSRAAMALERCRVKATVATRCLIAG